jgi:hypothetical protein
MFVRGIASLFGGWIGWAGRSSINSKETLSVRGQKQALQCRGREGGRKEKLSPSQVETMRKMSASRQPTVIEICRVMAITKPTYYRYMNLES